MVEQENQLQKLFSDLHMCITEQICKYTNKTKESMNANKIIFKLGVVACLFNPRAQEAEAGNLWETETSLLSIANFRPTETGERKKDGGGRGGRKKRNFNWAHLCMVMHNCAL